MCASGCGVGVIFLCAILSIATAQAPGDEDGLCITSEIVTPPVFPTKFKILMDSYNYINLLLPSKPTSSHWQQVDNDNTTDVNGMPGFGSVS